MTAAADTLAGASAGLPGGAGGPIGAAGSFDYDELARRLLVQVVRRLAAAAPEASLPEHPAASPPPDLAEPPDQAAPPDQLALQETVSGLEYELATAWTKHGKLAEENVRLREQLKAAQRSLALAAERVRGLPTGADLNSNEVLLLQRLLTSEPAADSAGEPAAEASGLLS
jgi:hypothetical protein